MGLLEDRIKNLKGKNVKIKLPYLYKASINVNKQTQEISLEQHDFLIQYSPENFRSETLPYLQRQVEEHERYALYLGESLEDTKNIYSELNGALKEYYAEELGLTSSLEKLEDIYNDSSGSMWLPQLKFLFWLPSQILDFLTEKKDLKREYAEAQAVRKDFLVLGEFIEKGKGFVNIRLDSYEAAQNLLQEIQMHQDNMLKNIKNTIRPIICVENTYEHIMGALNIS